MSSHATRPTGDPESADTAGAADADPTAGAAEPEAGVPEEDPAPGDEVPGQHEPVSKLAIFALVTGILPTIPLALVGGIAALAGIRRSGRRGHGMAVTALFLAGAWLIVGGAVATVAVLTHGFKKPVTTIYHEASVFKLRAGQCIDIQNGSTPSVVSCTAPHDAEVVGTFTLPGAAWPGTAAVRQEAGAGCGTRLGAYLNPELAINLAQTYVYPGRVDWKAGTRTVICEVRAPSGQLTGSVRAATATNG